MDFKIVVIGDRDTITGFRLAGAEGQHVDASSEARAAFERAVASPDTGLIILTQRWAQEMRELVESARRRLMPLIIEIPDRRGPIEKESLVKKIRAILGA